VVELPDVLRETVRAAQPGPLRLVDPKTNETFVLLRDEDYERLKGDGLASSWKDLQAKLAATRVGLQREADVRSYLERHPDTSRAVEAVCQSARQALGDEAKLVLELTRDRESEDAHLSLVVRLPAYPPDTMERLQRIADAHDDLLCAASGSLVVTTDFIPAR
jgi:hypothetical protein